MKTLISDVMRHAITSLVKAQGFDAVGFSPASLPAGAEVNLEQFIALRYYGDMDWMATHAARRKNPKALWEEAKTVIVVAHNYAPSYNPLDLRGVGDSGLVSCYALGKDYHDVMKKKLREVASAIAVQFGVQAKIFVDTAPLMEKPLASQTQVGWQGKHSCVVSREFGSWLFLGEILIDHALEADLPTPPSCGKCSRCIEICPTQAFDKAYQLDARKCIAYLTIEHKGHIDKHYRAAIGNRIYGCDDCLAVCPWNKFAKQTQEIAYHANAQPLLPLEELVGLNDADFRKRFSGSPIKRIKRDRFIRNVLIAIGNSKNSDFLPYLAPRLTDESPLVRAMAVWAFQQLAEKEEVEATRTQCLALELDEQVHREWQAGDDFA